ncbi:MAG: glycosyltransferase family 2 protein [Verrucomicrobiales bacterium]|nr:glycosyltransferase family 2 protein [Verrucomicrobiales bacterium]
MKISFCLITLNEEQNLARCLRSCSDLADEIVVVDSGSTDRTARVAHERGARWIEQPWLGFVGQKNRAVELATQDWIFSIDADEELSRELHEEVRQLKLHPPALEISGFSMPRCVLYEGRWIRHGDWYPDRLVRLFRRERGQFTGGKVHERLKISGKIRALKGELFHHSFQDAADHWARCQKYARLWAETQHEAGRSATCLAPALHALVRGFRAYVLRRGFLDGRLGWRIALFSAREVYLKYALLRQMSSGTKPRELLTNK